MSNVSLNVAKKLWAVIVLMALVATSFPFTHLALAQSATVFSFADAAVTIASPYESAVVDTSTVSDLVFSFDYEAESLDNGDSFSYGWSDGTIDHVLGTVPGTNESGAATSSATDETGAISVMLPATSSVATFNVFVSVSANVESDTVNISNVQVAGEEVDEPEEVATIVFEKVVCEALEDMPAHGDVRPVGEMTAADWVAEYDSCSFAPGYSMEWAPQGTSDPGDELIGSAGAPWEAIGPTDESGFASTTLTAAQIGDDTHLWAREILPEGFETFSHEEERDNSDVFSSQFFCHTDGKNFDNFDRIDGIAVGETYYCAAWNLVEQPRLVITDPEADGETLEGSYTFEAEYVDADDIFDAMRWAVRAGGGECNGATLFGNVGGADDAFTYDGADFAATLDLGLLEDGNYCLVLNPAESSGEDFRAIREFTVEATTPICSVVVVSDGETTVVENDDGPASVLSVINGAWTAMIDGADWIWSSDVTSDEPGTKTFEQTFAWSGPVTDATLIVAADNTYTTMVNGTSTGGDNNSQNFRDGQEDSYDVTNQIIEGENSLSIAVTNLGSSNNPASLRYRLEVNGTDPLCAELPVDEAPEVPATLEITTPAEDDLDFFMSEYIFTAEYVDNDDEVDPIKWAVRADGEACFGDTIIGNVGGQSDPSTFSSTTFSATVDFSDFEAGEYCFVVNPQEGDDEDLRAVRVFSVVEDPVMPVVYGAYCGDGLVNQEWETCDNGHLSDEEVEEWDGIFRFGMEPGHGKGRSCTDSCTSAFQCSDLALAQINLDENLPQVSFNEGIYVGTTTAAIPSGAWFLLEQSDMPANRVANNTDGLGVSWDTAAGSLDVALRGGNNSGERDSAIGSVIFKGVEADSVSDNIVFTSYKLATDRNDALDIFSDDEVAFTMIAGSGKDGFTIFTDEADDPHTCPDCLATVEARIVAIEDGISTTGVAELTETVYLGDGSSVAFGEWFEVFDGTTFVEDEDGVREFENPSDLPGVFVSRVGEGAIHVRLHGNYERPDGEPVSGREELSARIEIRDANLIVEETEGVNFESHGPTIFDDFEVSTSSVDFFMRVGTGSDELHLFVDPFAIDACRFDTKEFSLSGHKFNDENQNGEWDDVENTLAGWSIFATNGEETLMTETDERGYYEFTVDAGEWTVYEAQREYWTQTAPEGQFSQRYGGTVCQVEFVEGRGMKKPEGDRFEGLTDVFDNDIFAFAAPREGGRYERVMGATCNFGNYYSAYTVEGYKFNDLDQDGEWGRLLDEEVLVVSSSTEFGLSGWTIELSNGSTTLSTTTDENGYYSFVFTESGEWTVSEVQQAGWTQSAPASGTCSAVFGSLETAEVATSSLRCDFGNYEAEVETDDDTTATSTDDGGTGGGSIIGRSSAFSGGPTPQVLGASTTASFAAQCGVYLEDYLKQAMENDAFEVIKLQLFLNWQGIETPITGTFDQATEDAVKVFQLQYSEEVLLPWFEIGFTQDLNPSGFVYKTTRWKINDLVCPGVEEYPSLP